MEHPDCVLHEDILFSVVEAFYPAAVPLVADSAAAAGFHLVAVCLGFCGFFAGIHRFVVCKERNAIIQFLSTSPKMMPRYFVKF